jgi:hypothetical protein
VKYIIQADIDGETGIQIEAQPEKIQEIIGKWQALNPLGMYFSLHRRRLTIVVEVPSEDSFLEALHATWVWTKNYPEVWPVAGVDEFAGLMQRLGMTP